MRQPVDCHYIDEGEGECVFLVHGIGASTDTWGGVAERIKSEFRCIRPDLRGHGKSPKPPLPYYLDDLVVDVEHLRAKLGVERIHVFGHSLGGMIAPAYALAFPENTASIGMVSTAAGRTQEDFGKLMGVIEALERDGVEACLDQLVTRWFTDDFGAASPEIIEARRQCVLDTDEGVFKNVFHIYAETELAPKLNEIQTPTLVLTGEFDGGCNPRLNTFIAGEVPNSELVILKDLKHAILLEAPERVAEAMLKYLNGLA